MRARRCRGWVVVFVMLMPAAASELGRTANHVLHVRPPLPDCMGETPASTRFHRT